MCRTCLFSFDKCSQTHSFLQLSPVCNVVKDQFSTLIVYASICLQLPVSHFILHRSSILDVYKYHCEQGVAIFHPVELSFPRLKAQEPFGMSKTVIHTPHSTSWNTWAHEKWKSPVFVCDLLKIKRLKSGLEHEYDNMYICLFPGCFMCFFTCFFPNIVAVAKSPSTAQEALQKMRISRQVHLPQLHTPEQITEVLGGVGFVSHENQLDVFFGQKEWMRVSTTIITNIASDTPGSWNWRYTFHLHLRI